MARRRRARAADPAAIVAALRSPALLDDSTRAQYAALIEQRYGVAIGGGDLTVLAARGGALHVEHDREARRLLPALRALLERQRDERTALLRAPLARSPGRSYAQIAADVAACYPSAQVAWADLIGRGARPLVAAGAQNVEQRLRTTGTFLDALIAEYEQQSTLALALLGRLALLAGPAAGVRGAGPRGAVGKADAARGVAAYLRRHGRLGWDAVAAVLAYHGWDCGAGTLRSQGERLRKLATKRA